MKIRFIPTKKFVIILLLGVIPLLTGGPWIDPIAIFLVYNLIVLTLGVVDYFFLSFCSFSVERRIKDRFSPGTENTVTIYLFNKSSFTLNFHIKDDYPRSFKCSRKILYTSLKPLSGGDVCYSLIPYERGNYRFCNIYIRYYSFMGFMGRLFVYDKTEEVKVYPNIENISRYQLMTIKGGLHRTGIKPVRIPGRGMDFESLREYVPDDDYRIINWKATARRGKFIVNQYDEEKSQNIFIILDAGRMMTGSAGKMSKIDYAVNAVLMLSYVSSLRGDRAGLLVFASDIKAYLPPSGGRKQVQLILEILYDLQPECVEPDYSLAFGFLGTRLRKRSLVFLFTDLMDQHSSEELVKYFPTLSPPHLPFCVVLSDPEVEKISSHICRSSGEIYQQAIAQEILWDRKKALARLEKAGVSTMDILPRELSLRVVNEYLKIKSMARL